ncbi:MAG: signal peptide peptidase SppA [archaeon]
MGKSEDKGKKALLIVAVAFVVLAALSFMLFLAVAQTDFGGFEKKLAVIQVKGDIVMDSTDFSQSAGALGLVQQIDDADNDGSVSAIFFDIDSGGGEIVATHQVVEKIRETKKPTISYIGSVGASGAYYIAAATDYVIADPFSVTGSIGALWMLPNVKKLLDDFGVKMDVVRSGGLKALPNPFEEISPEQKQLISGMVSESFEQFKSDVLEFRGGKVSPQSLSQITDGRIISGKQALEMKLVDQLLTREKAIKKAAEIAGIKGKPALKEFGAKRISLFDIFAQSGHAFADGIKSSLEFSGTQAIRS